MEWIQTVVPSYNLHKSITGTELITTYPLTN